MAGFKSPDFKERAAAAQAQRERAMELLRNKPAHDPAIVAERQAARAAREAAEAERRAARRRAAEEAKAAAAVKKAEALAASAAQAPERPQLSDAERKALRDARYAARKARKK
ncbi:DUF6481 family protein [Sphingomonas nostoxanthinifaciens]|uniref:DUF6481 family protein n=1 Tax=Sphingomonas nostoxanthinifaciens TaxID=2872652 RepID=UPI001CC1DBE0|nr:DUF6481 family protein [Sphingomonas nostoxanthinifaciens]UAK23208.1 DUF6481 family protein [Sphingomonas nostoxanthinifaciens]